MTSAARSSSRRTDAGARLGELAAVVVVVGTALTCCSCRTRSTPSPEPPSTRPPTAAPGDAGPCGFQGTDWCPAPVGDPCGEHKNTASCRADPRCVGMQYRGESGSACMGDERGFTTNCPNVGCATPSIQCCELCLASAREDKTGSDPNGHACSDYLLAGEKLVDRPEIGCTGWFLANHWTVASCRNQPASGR